jgi:hypothetical protein
MVIDMGLHGELVVNSQPIGAWYACRTQPPEGSAEFMPDGVNVYECEVFRYEDGKKGKFMVKHNYSDGAFVLASKVMDYGAYYLKTLEPAAQGQDLGQEALLPPRPDASGNWL